MDNDAVAGGDRGPRTPAGRYLRRLVSLWLRFPWGHRAQPSDRPPWHRHPAGNLDARSSPTAPLGPGGSPPARSCHPPLRSRTGPWRCLGGRTTRRLALDASGPDGVCCGGPGSCPGAGTGGPWTGAVAAAGRPERVELSQDGPLAGGAAGGQGPVARSRRGEAAGGLPRLAAPAGRSERSSRPRGRSARRSGKPSADGGPGWPMVPRRRSSGSSTRARPAAPGRSARLGARGLRCPTPPRRSGVRRRPPLPGGGRQAQDEAGASAPGDGGRWSTW